MNSTSEQLVHILQLMGEEEWMDVAEYFGNSPEIIHQVQELEGRVALLLATSHNANN
jgi:phosphohistidine phosphatase SixA